jgi:hypothetical protein
LEKRGSAPIGSQYGRDGREPWWVSQDEVHLDRLFVGNSDVENSLYRRLRGRPGSCYTVRKYDTESEAYRDLGRAMAEEYASSVSTTSQPATKEPTMANETKTEAKAPAQKPEYVPYPRGSERHVYWYTGNDIYAPANLPAALFAGLTQAETKSGDWAYYPTKQLALADLVAAQLALESATAPEIKEEVKEEPKADPRPTLSCGWWYFQTKACYDNSRGGGSDPNNVVTDEVLRILVEVHPDQSGCTNLPSGWVAYRTREDAERAYRYASAFTNNKIRIIGRNMATRDREPI